MDEQIKQPFEQENKHYPLKKEGSIERVEAHLNKLHDFVRSLDLRLESLEFESEKKREIAKAVAAKIGKVKTQWQQEEAYQGPGQAAQQRRTLQPGQKCRGGQQ